jgi:glycosyltransferase involved in cell wall biosynthesis
MHIVQLFNGIIPPITYGGVERMVFWLTRELAKSGHRVTVMAAPGSTIHQKEQCVQFIALNPTVSDYRAQIPDKADIIHIHNISSSKFLPDIPYLVTEHGNRHRFRGHTPNTVFLSANHAKNHRAKWYVYNGIPKDEYPLHYEKKDFILFLAKLNWRIKNAKTAIKLSFDTGMPLMLTGGELRRSRKVWGLWMLRSLFKPDMIQSKGFVAGRKKRSLLQSARVLFYIVNWHEPFALAPHEALACGTPVLASPNGALPEYIKDGVNGFIARNYQEACVALQQLKCITDKERKSMAECCRESAFSIVDSAKAYVELYQKVIREGNLYSDEEVKEMVFERPSAYVIKR